MAQTLTFDKDSDSVADSLHLIEHEIPTPQSDEVLVRILAAPINPLDILVLQDKYPVKPQSTEQGRPIPGYDGVAEILGVGSNVKHISAGEKVIIKRHGLGTWRTHACLNAHDVLKIPGDMEPVPAAMLRMGMLMAYLMLQENIVSAKPGDWVIMNGATGVIAHFLGQFAHLRGLKVVSVIRDRPEATQAAKMLKNHGAELVLMESELNKSEELGGKRIMLAFDAVFGAAGQNLIDTLSPGGTYVSYGFLGGLGPDSNISISQPLIFLKNLTFKAFRLSASLANLSDETQEALCIWAQDLIQEGRLTMPLVDVVDWNKEASDEGKPKEAIVAAIKGEIGQQKKVFVFPG